MTLNLTAFAVVFLLIAVQASENNHTGLYTIIGSQQISLHRPYHVSVTLHNTTEPAIVRLKLIHEFNETEKEIVKQVTVQPWTTQLIEFDTSSLESKPNSFYRLIADGIDKIDFHNETDLTLSAKYFSFLIQTDKALYKPGDLVRFRVLVVDKDTKAHNLVGALQVNVYDGDGNRIKLFANQSTANGVYTNEFQLSDSPVMGNWKLTFTADSEEKSKSFEVGEYVLPTFEAFIESPEHVLYADQVIRANVRGKYTFGKPVHGTANCTGSWNGKESNKLLKVTTKGSLEINFVDELQVDYANSNYIQISCTLEEEFTGRKQSTSMGIQVHRFKYSITKQSYNYDYLDGRPFEFDVHVQLYDGTPIRNESVEIWWTTDLSAKDGIGSKTVQTNGEGVANVKLTFPEGKVTVYLMAKYKEHAEGLGHFSSSIYHARGADSIPEFDIRTNDTNISVGDTVKIDLVSRTPLKHFTYQVIARGNIIISNSQTVQAGANGFHFTATFDMVPNVQVVAYTIRDDGNVDTASRRIYLQKKLQNQITLESAVNETEPGTEYDLKITTAPNSYVGLLAVDQSVLLLRSGNDLSVDDVTDDLDQYNNVVSNRRHNYHRRYYWSQTISTIENAGMFVLSNVNDFIPKPIEEVEYYTTTAGYHTKRISVVLHDEPAPQFLAQASPIASGQSSVTVRKDFPETWIWDGLQVDSGEQHFKKRVPDTITSWVISAFSVSTVNGLGLTKEPTKVTTFKLFFVSVSLPFSVKRGEILSIPVTIFNYLDTTVNADVTFFNDDGEFEFVDLNDEANEIVNADQRRQRKLLIKSNDANGLFFSIRPLKVGQLTIKVIVESALAGDGIQKILLVTPEGVPQYVNKALMLNLPNADGSTVDHDFTIDLPEHTVPDSAFIQISLVGDILGSTVKNLNRLIYMPSGCGEQNMAKFVPNIIVRNYLTAIGQLSEDLEEKTRRNLEIGYQRQLSFRHSNGSFSAFGQQDRRGSTWLTAFVARSFQQASKHINIEPRIINETLNFLNKTQSANGSFTEYGDVIHRRMQGGADGNVALTAYTLIAFLENREAFPSYEDNIKRATGFIVQHLDILDDVYSLSLVAYALQLAKDSNKDKILRDLNAKVITESERRHWSTRKPSADYYPSSIDTEITGYAMLANFHADRTDDVVPILKWLLSQRNERGGFVSTQDTIVGLQAITTIATKVTGSAAGNAIGIDISSDGNSNQSFEVNSGNAQILQQIQMPSQARKINVKARGTGFTLASLSYKYYINETAAAPRFTIETTVKPTEYPSFLEFDVCVAFIPKRADGAANDESTESNMAVMEIDLPSGYQFDADQRQALQWTQSVKKVETRNDDTQIVLYFERLTTVKICPQVKAIRTHKVAHQKPAAIVVYDYYDTTRKSRVFYNTDEKSLCDICETDCPARCNV